MRRTFLIVPLLLLAACSQEELSFPALDGKPADAPSAAAAANYAGFQSEPTEASRCTKLAEQRRGDARAQGFKDDDTLQQVYDRTYADCMNWAARRARQ